MRDRRIGDHFLKIGLGARPVAMGETFVGIADDVNAIYWNPAGLNYIVGSEMTAMHALWFEDITFSFIGYCRPFLSGKIGLGLNIIGVIILGFQPYVTLWGTGTRAKYPFLNILGWGLLGVGFLVQLLAKEK